MNSIVYAFRDKLGGIASLNANLISHNPDPGVAQYAILYSAREEPDTPISEPLDVSATRKLVFSNHENRSTVMSRFAGLMFLGPGVLISNDALELATFSKVRPERTIFQIVHDDFNFSLSLRYERVIDVMIAHSRHMYEKLMAAFPRRLESIFFRPYGINLAPVIRKPTSGPLRLVFLGRLSKQKGIFDLPVIDRLLADAGIEVVWTVIGSGPEKDALQLQWPASSKVRYHSPATNAEVIDTCAAGDVLVLPTRFEGFPVALLEAMSAGLVPIISDLEGGIREVVVEDTGFRVPPADTAAFAARISQLAHSREMLEGMSRRARLRSEAFDGAARALEYHELFDRWAEFKRRWNGPYHLSDLSRLDSPYIPNSLTYVARKLMVRARQCAATIAQFEASKCASASPPKAHS